MLKERNKRGGHRHNLRGRHVHVLDFFRARKGGLAIDTHRDQIALKLARAIDSRVGLRNDVPTLFNGRQVVDLVGYTAVHNLSVRRFKKTVVIKAGIQGQGVDETNVWTLRGLDGADTTVVGGVHVTHFKACAFAGQAARSKRRDTSFVSDLGQGVGLVHKLRELGRPKELANGSRDGLAVNKVVRLKVVGLGLTKPLFHGPLNTHEPGTKLIFGKLTHASHAAVAQVIDVIDLTTAVAQFNKQLDGVQNVFVR